jgi:hypothetical protein
VGVESPIFRRVGLRSLGQREAEDETLLDALRRAVGTAFGDFLKDPECPVSRVRNEIRPGLFIWKL